MYGQRCFFLLFCLLRLSTSDYADIQVSTGSLVSRDVSAGCREHRTIVCESNPVISLTQSIYNLGQFKADTPTPPDDICPSSSCWSPPPLKYQILHDTGDTQWSLIVKWETPPANVLNCSVLEYHVIVERLQTISNLTCGDISSLPSWYFGPFNNTVSHIYFNEDFLSDPEARHQYHIKVISSSIEYPLLVVTTPNECNQQYFTGCQNCQDQSCTPDLSPPIINVTITDSSSPDDLQVLVTINDSYAQEYFLHTLSSGRKMLHKLTQDTRSVYLSKVPYNNETLVWIEKFSCGCSNSSLIYAINENSTSIISTSHSVMKSTTPHSSHTLTPSSLPSTDTQPTTTSINSNAMSINSNTMSINSNTMSINSNTISINSNTMSINSNTISINSNVSSTPSHSSDPSASTNNRNNILIIIILPVSLFILAVILVILTVVGFLLHKRRNKCIDTVCSDVPPVLDQPDTTINNTMMKYFTESVTTTSVISIIPHDTPSDDKEAYLVFLNELVPHGADLEVYCRSQRVTPADWLQSVFKRESIVLIIINEGFYDEWVGQAVSDVPVVFALKQLVHSLVQQSLELKNFLIILPTPSDKKYIPDYYLFHTLQRFDLQDTEGIARYIFKVPEFTVDSTC